jgi:TolA-binding protein
VKAPVARAPVAAAPSEVAPAAEAAPSEVAPAEAAPSEVAPVPTARSGATPVPESARHLQGAVKRAAVSSASLQIAPSASTSEATPKSDVSKESGAKEPAVKEAPSASKLFGEANQARRSGDIGRASGLYHLLQDQFPSSPEAELSRVTLALLLLDSGDAQGALSGFERYLAGSSRALEAEALVGRARALGRLGRRDLEAAAWREVQRKYPRSIYGRQASERLLALGLP